MKPLRCLKCRRLFPDTARDHAKPIATVQVECPQCGHWQTPTKAFDGATPILSTVAGKYERSSGV